MNTALHFSSDRMDWETPPGLFGELNDEFNFSLDVCATVENAKCIRFFTKDDDGLSQEWKGICWMNPPYGREIGKWVCKAYESSLRGATIVCLLPSRTDTKWWHKYCMKGEIRYLRGRITFVGALPSWAHYTQHHSPRRLSFSGESHE